MAAPAFGTAGTFLTGANGTSAAVAVPSGVAADDIVLVHLYKENTAAVTPPAGFTEIGTVVTTSGVHSHSVFWKRATGADSGTYTFSWTGSVWREGVAERYTDCITTGSPVDVSNSATRSTAGTVTPAVSVTTTGADRLLVWSGTNWSGAGPWTPPSGWTERVDNSENFSVATLAQATAGSSGSITGTATNSDTETAWLVALLPTPSTVSKSGSDSGTGSETGTVTATVTGSDTGTGSEAGSAALLVAGSDSGSGSETGFVALPQTGSDTATGSEAGSIDATTTGGDSGAGSEAGLINADTTGGDTGTGSSSGFITIPGGDSGAGASALVSLLGNTTGGDSGTGSDGGYVEALYGDLVISLFAIHPTTGATVPLPDFTNLTISPERNSAGSITLDYPETGLNFDLLRSVITSDRDLEVEIWTIGEPLGALRGYLQEATGDDVSEDVTTWKFAGSFLPIRMSEAIVYPQPANEKQELVFSFVTPGAMIATCLAQAQARGTLTDITLGFSDTVDSNGTAWPSVITTKFSPGAGYDQILNKLVDLGLAEWDVAWTGTAKQLRLWIPQGRGTDRTIGSRPIVLRAARNLLEAPRKWSVRDSGTAILAAGSEGVYETAADASALSRRGRRIELSASANNLSDSGAVQAFAQAQLAVLAPGTLEVTHGLGFLPGEPRPVIAFDVGDWVYSQTGTTMDRLRVVQWTLTVSPTDNPSGTVTLNDQMTDQLMRQQRRLNALTSGDTVVGTSESSTDTGVPLPPTALTASSLAFLVGGDARAAVQVGWTAPTTNVDGSAITDLAGYTVMYGFGLSPTTWIAAAAVNSGSATSATFTTDPGTTIAIRAAAFDHSGNVSAWSSPVTHTTATDVTGPPAPSAPVVGNYLGVLRITWDGLTSTGATMLSAAADFDHVDVHVSTSSGFTPSAGTYFDRLFAAGTVVYTSGTYGVTYYAKFVAVDGSGNTSAGSAQGSDIPTQVVSPDIFDGAVGSAKLADLAVTTAKIDDLAVNNAKIGDLSVGKLTAGTLSVAVTLSGIIRTGTTGARSEIDAAGIRLYDASNNVRVNFKTTDGSALVTGEYRTALTGQRIVMNPAGALPDTINVYPSGASDFARIMARTAPSDGTAAVLIDGGAATGVGRGRLGAYKSEAFVSWVTNDTGGDSSAGYSQTAVSCSANSIRTWAQDTIEFDKYSGATPLPQGHLYIKWVSGGAGANTPLLTANHASTNAGIKFDSGTIVATINEGSLFGPMNASAFNVVSTRNVKTDISDIRSLIDPIGLFRTVQAKTYKYRAEVAHFGDAAPQRFGPIAEDLPDELVHMTPYASTGELVKAVSLGDQVGVLWAVANQILAQRLVHITATVTPPPLTAANTDVDVTVPWDDGPAQTVPAQLSIVPIGLGPLQQRAIRAVVVDITTTGVTVRFRSTRALAGAAAPDPEDRYVVNAIYEFTPPWDGA